MAEQKKPINPVWAAAKPFVNGGLSGMISTVIIQPIDMVKASGSLGWVGACSRCVGSCCAGVSSEQAPGSTWLTPLGPPSRLPPVVTTGSCQRCAALCTGLPWQAELCGSS